MKPVRLIICLLVLFAIAGSRCEGQRARYNFNAGWLLWTGDDPAASGPAFDDAQWKPVTLPHAWNEDFAYRVAIFNQPTGIAWYRKHFKAPAVPAGGHVFVEFEGARQAAQVYLNGHLLGISENGVMAFGFDLTPYLQPGDNVLAVRTDNRWDYREASTNTTFEWNNKSFYSNFGGLNKNVWLHVTPSIYQTLPLFSSFGTTGQYIWADDFNIAAQSARIHIESQVRNDSPDPVTVQLRAVVADLEGKPVVSVTSPPQAIAPKAMQTLHTDALAHGLHFWSWGYGYQYTVTTTLVINGKATDSVATRTGFRQTAFRDGMVYLNGRVLQIHGYAARSTNEWPGLGTDVPPWVSDFSNGLLVSSNGNLVRWMHVTPSRQDVQSCDRVGLIESMPAGDAEGDPHGRQWQQRVELMRDSIVYNRNSPSILFYESGNKGISEEHMRDMLAVRDQFDPHGGRAIGAREMLASHTAEYGGEMLYIDKSATKPLWAHEYNRDEGARKFWNDQTPPFHKDAPLYNRNQDSFTLEDVVTWDDYFRARPGTGRRVSAGGANISWIDENSHFRGDNNYRRSGEVDSMRIPKDAFFAHQVMWDGWVDPEHPRVHINGHWNYAPGTVRTVYVEANTAFVGLTLNGRSLGIEQPTHDFLSTFANVSYEPGQLVATAYDEQKRARATTVLATAGPPAKIHLTPHTGPGGLRADGADLALIDVEVVDAHGQRVPTALNMVHFTLSGPAEWRGGIAQGSATPAAINTTPTDKHGLTAPFLYQDNYILSRDLPVEGGVNRVSVRSTVAAGEITITARADGLPDADLTILSHALPQGSDFSSDDPAAHLPANLQRGPTPSTPSFTVTRLSLPIASTNAGANAGDASRSCDDDETTAWSNAPDRRAGGSLGSAWIEYTLSAPSTPFQLDLKLGSFRTRRYPIRVTLDGSVVYAGTTPTSLGYITLPLRAAKPGTRLRIQLTAPAFNADEAHQLVELNGSIDQAAHASAKGEPVLNIIEADIYARPDKK